MGNYDNLTDFYCWTFSQSSNLIDLLTTEKQTANLQSKDQDGNVKSNVDASYNVTTDWRYMKEVYICLQKMVS
jgi:hypothetical protein